MLCNLETPFGNKEKKMFNSRKLRKISQVPLYMPNEMKLDSLREFSRRKETSSRLHPTFQCDVGFPRAERDIHQPQNRGWPINKLHKVFQQQKIKTLSQASE